MSGERTTAKRRRLSLRHLAALSVGALVLGAGFLVLKAAQNRRATPHLLVEAQKRWEQKQHSLALKYVGNYLDQNPNDLGALDLKAGFLAESAQDEGQVREAVSLHTKILGRDPARQDVRLRLVELYLRIPGMAKTAATLARELIRRGDDGAKAHRLLARALVNAATEGDDKALDEACREFEAAEKREPGDVEGGEQLARLYQERLNEPAKGQAVLDRMLALERKDPAQRAAVRLARARYCARLNQHDRALKEIALAIPDAPADIEVRLSAAQFAAQTGDTAGARRHLAAIPEAGQSDLRVKLLGGVIDLKERRPDDAIQSWRSGLLLTGGNHIELTWRLAQVLLEMGRVAEAEPLMAQYRRLVGGDEPNAWYRYLVALSLLKTNRPGDAVQELEAIQFKADKTLEPTLSLLMGQAYEAARDEAKALTAYRKTIELARELADPWLAIARLQWPRQPASALETVELGLKAVPAEPRLLAMLVHYRWLAQLQRPAAERSWAEVDQALAQAEERAPGSTEVALARAEYQLSLGTTDAALDVLAEATRRSPRYAALWTARARALSRVGRRQDALNVLDQAVSEAGPQAAFFIDRAAFLIARGHLKEAQATLKDGLHLAPAEQRPALWKALGEYYAGQKDPIAARHAFEECARLDPNNPEPQVLLLDLALATGDDAAIRARVDALKAAGGADGFYWRIARVQELLLDRPRLVGDAAGQAGRLDEAARLVREIQKREPRSPLGFLLEGRVCERKKQTDAALRAYEKSVDLNGGQLPLAALVGLLVRERRDADLEKLRKKLTVLPAEIDRLAALEALSLGDKDRAEQLAAKMVEGHPEALDAQVWQAQVLNSLGKPEAAEAALRRLTGQRPGDSSPWLQLLMLQVGQNRAKDAAETVEQIRKNVQSDHPELLWAQCYRAVGNLPRAEEFIREAIKKWPDDLDVRVAAISYCEQTGRQAEAEVMLRKVLERDPALGWAARKLALLRAGRRHDRSAWDEALRLIGPEAKPDDSPDDRLTRAHVYALGPEAGHRQEALKILDQLAAELPSAPAVHELMARIWLTSGDLVKAREHAAMAAGGPGASLENRALYTRVLMTAKDYEAAERQLQSLEAIDAQSLPVIELRARLQAAQGKPQEAADLLERASAGRLNTIRDLPTAEKLIRLLVELGQPEAALRVARAAGKLGTRGKCLLAEFLAQRPGFEKEARALVQAATDAGDPRSAGEAALAVASRPQTDPLWLDLADKSLEQARKEKPDDSELIERQATLRRLQRRHREEVALYQDLMNRDPRNSQFLNNMAWTLSEDLGDPKEALGRADEAVAKLGREPHLLDTRGVILTRLGKLDEAILDLETAADALHTGPVYFHLARAYQKKGRTEKFQKAVGQAKQAGLVPEQLQPSEREEWVKEISR